MALTRRQKQVMDFLSGFIEKHGFSPSYEEIAAGLGLASLATVHKHVQCLEAKQYLRRSYNHSRSLEIGERYFREEKARQPESEIPLLGRIAAGAPVEAIANPEPLRLSDFVGHGDAFALEVRGESMIDDHICDGDYILVERASQAANGEIVVALIDGSDATLKRFFHEAPGRVRLQPANSQMDPIVLPARSVRLQGRVIGVLRKY